MSPLYIEEDSNEEIPINDIEEMSPFIDCPMHDPTYSPPLTPKIKDSKKECDNEQHQDALKVLDQIKEKF